MANQDIPKLVKQWGELEAAGVPLEPLEDRVGLDARNSGSGLTIRPGRPRWRSEIRELNSGQFAFILPIFIRRDRPGKMVILDAWIGTSWPDTCIEWLEDPEHEEKHPGYYNLPGDTERFLREEVLNHRFINCVPARGDIRAGLLLAVGSRPPDDYKDHTEILVSLTVVDQWDVEHRVMLPAKMNRHPARAKAITRSVRGPLLSRRDVIVPSGSHVGSWEPMAESRQKEAAAHRRLRTRFASSPNAAVTERKSCDGHGSFRGRRVLGNQLVSLVAIAPASDIRGDLEQTL